MVTFLITQPTAGTSTITWNTVWKVGTVGTAPAATKTKAFSFFNFDGVNWRLMYTPVET